MKGKIVKGISGFYYVHVAETGIYECKAKGIFRNQKIKIRVRFCSRENYECHIDICHCGADQFPGTWKNFFYISNPFFFIQYNDFHIITHERFNLLITENL